MRGDNLKITFIGESATGKTTIAIRFVHNKFVDNPGNTIGACFMTMRNIDNIKFDVWDTAGQERYAAILPMYYRDTDLFIMVFDTNNLFSFNKIHTYINDINDIVKSKYKIIIVGNKIDLLTDPPENINKFINDQLKKYNNFESFDTFLISAKDGTNFDKLVEHIFKYAKDLINNKKINNQLSINDDGIILDDTNDLSKMKCKC